MKDNPAVVGSDEGAELRDGHAQFSFAVTGWPRVKHGDQELDPTHGFATASMADGVWTVSFAHLYGPLIGKRGNPVRKEIHFSYSFGEPIDPGTTWHPDYAPPQKLIDFVAAFEARLSGRTEA
ncbi:hypothetical protein ACFW2V_12260 [Streptomyces sp. NPDC058947]|uniref:hypothetical protein n=1 Tax=Streptomyces sp. NPDC058947 TaxID=3346675 RepID=UPI00367B533C